MADNVTLDSLLSNNKLLDPDGPVCLIVRATMGIAAGLDRFQPAGFPEIGHVIYDAPRTDKEGKPFVEKVCIVDSPASMANHLEQVCLEDEGGTTLHPDLERLPYVKLVTDRDPVWNGSSIVLKPDDPRDKLVTTSLTEGHRIGSEYILDGMVSPQWVEAKKVTSEKDGKKQEKTVPAHWEGEPFREVLRREFRLETLKPGERYYVYPDSWPDIYRTIFAYDPNSLVHGVLFAMEQIKISRMLTAHMEAFGAARWGRSGVKFNPVGKETNRQGKKTSGQPIFAVDEETAHEIRATFIIDLAMLRSFGREVRGSNPAIGLDRNQKTFLLALALWKVRELLRRTFSYRSGCKLKMQSVAIRTDEQDASDDPLATTLPVIDMPAVIQSAKFTTGVTSLYYPADELFHAEVRSKPDRAANDTDEDEEDEGEHAARH